MKHWPKRLSLALLISLFAAGVGARQQNLQRVFDSRAIEGATAISGGTCSNHPVGISYQLPEGMKPEDAAALRMVERQGEIARTGIGPEAGYFLFGYAEGKTMAILCGAASETGQVMVIATSTMSLQQLGPNPLEKIVEGMAQEFGGQPSAAVSQKINGLEFERADVHDTISSQTGGKIELWGSVYATEVNSYVVMWNLAGYSEEEWRQLVAGMDSVKIFPPAPISATESQNGTAFTSTRTPVAPDFQTRLDAFLSAWITGRDQKRTMEFFDSAAFSAPPLIGSYCDGWYRKGAQPGQAAQIISSNMMGVPSDFPRSTTPSAIFSAWDRLPPQWAAAAANDVSKDHFLVAGLDEGSLGRIFSGVFAGSDYANYLKGEIAKRGKAFWVVFPEVMRDGDIFVIFTLWQNTNTAWHIVHVDIVCQ